MKLWKRTSINVISLSAILISALTVRWGNETLANLCPPGHCCYVGSSYTDTAGGTHILYVNMTCGSYWVYAFADGGRYLIVCPTGQGCQGSTF